VSADCRRWGWVRAYSDQARQCGLAQVQRKNLLHNRASGAASLTHLRRARDMDTNGVKSQDWRERGLSPVGLGTRIQTKPDSAAWHRFSARISSTIVLVELPH
jgi:hypothetical protein